MKVLVLGGTTEARVLAGELVAGHDVTVSLAGRVRSPRPLPGRVRIGGLGGVAGLVAWLRANATAAVVDATHPFASTMTAHAAAACALAAVPLLRLQRPAWAPVPGDDWRAVRDLPAAAEAVAAFGDRGILTTGRSGLAVFAWVDRWVLGRAGAAYRGGGAGRLAWRRGRQCGWCSTVARSPWTANGICCATTPSTCW